MSMAEYNRPPASLMVNSLPMQQLDALERMGNLMSASGMFGLNNPEQGFVIALTCQMEGITPLQFIRRYHIILKRPSMRADAMLAEFRMRGGQHEVVELTPDRVYVKLKPPGTEKWYDCTVTWDEMQKEPWPWVNKDDKSKGLKDSWATPLQRQGMMFNRLVSDRIRKLCPEINAGIYTPEEIQDTVTEPPAPTASLPQEQLDAMLAPQDNVIDVEPMQVNPVKADLEDIQKELENPELVGPPEAEKIYDLFNKLGTSSPKRAKTFESYGVKSVFDMTKAQAAELVGRLEAALAKKNGGKKNG